MNTPNPAGQQWDERSNAKVNAFAETESMFHLLFERTADAVWLFDPSTAQVMDCNHATVALMRCGQKEMLLGKRLEELAPATQPDGTSSKDALAGKIEQTL